MTPLSHSFRQMKRAVITGGSGTLGRGIATELEHPEWDICTPPRSELDVRDEAAVETYFKSHPADLLVCVAGAIRDAPLLRTDETAWDEIIAVNFNGAAACARQALPHMVEKRAGHIVFISSFSALHPPVGQIAYATAKAALLGLTAELASRHGCNNIRVNAILPGFMDTRMTEKVCPKRRAEIHQAHVLRRFNTAETVGRFIRHLHHELLHTSGQIFQLDSRIP